MNLDHEKIKQIITNEEQSKKKITLTNLAALTGYTYQQLYYNGYKKIASKHRGRKFNRVKELPTDVVPELDAHDSQPNNDEITVEEAKKASQNTVDLFFRMGSKTLNVHIQDLTEANIDDAIEDFEFIFKKVIQKLKREKVSIQNSKVQEV